MINININLFKGIVNEEWRPIKGFPGYYISDQGRVKSLKRRKEKLLKQWLGTHGYPQVTLSNEGQLTTETVHRLVAKAFLGISDDQEIDHIDGNPLNNRLDNLRVCSHAENMKNRRRHSNNSSGFPGVSYHKASGKYQAQIWLNGRNKHLGLFKTPEEAAIAYKNASLKLHGAFSPFVSRDEFIALDERVSTLERLLNLKGNNISEGVCY